MTEMHDEEKIRSVVRQAYGGIARRYVGEPEQAPAVVAVQRDCCGPSTPTSPDEKQAGCCGGSAEPASPDRAQTSCCGPQASSPAASTFYSHKDPSVLPALPTTALPGSGFALGIG